MTSGAIQYGVPTKDFLLGISLLIWAQNPKSDSLIWSRNTETHIHKQAPIWSHQRKMKAVSRATDGLTRPSSESRMESLLMSLWMTPCEWRYASACSTASHTVAICSSLSLDTISRTHLHNSCLNASLFSVYFLSPHQNDHLYRNNSLFLTADRFETINVFFALQPITVQSMGMSWPIRGL